MAPRIGFWLGLALFALMMVLPAPEGLSLEGWRVAAVALLVGTWWMTEALPLPATALLPFLLFPLLGAGSAADVASDYYSPVIFLVLGGSLIALSIERVGLHRRIALGIVKRGGTSPRALLFAYMVATALVSAFVSNTATAVVMLPIALALIRAVVPEEEAQGAQRPFTAALVLGVAYAASIGGLATIVGSPTNAIAAGLIEKTSGIEIDFVTWAAFGTPLVLIAIPLAWFIIARVLNVPTTPLDRAQVLAGIGAPGAWGVGELRLLPILAVTVFCWVAFPFLREPFGIPPIDDGMIAVAAGLLVLMVSDGKGGRLLDWGDTVRAPWGVILMYGGGLALAEAITGTGLSTWMGEQLRGVGSLPVWAIALILTGLVVIVTEFASNVATATGFMPVIAGLVLVLGIDPALLAFPAACAASWGFMMPAGSAPNALALATGYPKVADFIKTGFWLDLLGIPLIVAVCFAAAALT
ncbi:SLC13 family permease [Sphingoaurantiacus capsulatus]|uniref:SLC13 family permease n=1 Tax=Sphingoaurantiacus capsulatus TaxID=1771310 RepID=A0ABV7X4V2_9SPHN